MKNSKSRNIEKHFNRLQIKSIKTLSENQIAKKDKKITQASVFKKMAEIITSAKEGRVSVDIGLLTIKEIITIYFWSKQKRKIEKAKKLTASLEK